MLEIVDSPEQILLQRMRRASLAGSKTQDPIDHDS
jgi:hypothetical protein